MASNSDIYYQSQAEADADLARFGIESPTCELWSNWRKICSRTGSDRSDYCIEGGRSVRPSMPFCARGTGTPWATNNETGYRSIRRFCEEGRNTSAVDGQGNIVWAGFVCDRFEFDRPFNGRRLRELRHPFCKDWAKNDLGIWQCAAWQKDSSLSCDDGVYRQREAGPSEIVIPHEHDPESVLVYGVYCRVSG